MHRPFQRFKQILNFFITRAEAEVHGDGGDNKSLFGLRMPTGREAAAKQSVDGTFERAAGAAGFFLHKVSDIVVESESGSHIMMLLGKAS